MSSEGKSERDDSIVIHVCDESRKINRDFRCSKKILLAEMKYFKTYLSGTSAYDDIDISVHCDVHIFDWLMQYVKALHSKDQQNRPKLDTRLYAFEFKINKPLRCAALRCAKVGSMRF